LFLCAALADKPLHLLVSGETGLDVRATIACLQAFGADIKSDTSGFFVKPRLTAPQTNAALLDCGESGTTLRFLLPVAAALGVEVVCTGYGRLPDRPLEPLAHLLCEHGVTLRFSKNNTSLPLSLSGKLQAGSYALPGNVSSQMLSGLLFALPLLEGDSEIVLTTPLESAGYVAMTIEVLRRFGVVLRMDNDRFLVPGGQHPQIGSQTEIEASGDWSNAGMWLAAGAIAGEVDVSGLYCGSTQPDKEILALLQRMDADITEQDGRILVRSKELQASELDAANCPDLVPTAAALMLYAHGESRIYNASRLRLKESDRLKALTRAFAAMGANITETEDGLRIVGSNTLHGGCTVSAQNDHRIAMAVAVAALRAEQPVILSGSEAVAKSYPAFWDIYDRLLSRKAANS
jgi:3-phosphoshikimate 1-carboxyvinyltransferase